MEKHEIFNMIERYYDVDLDNCTMSHEAWINEIVKALTDYRYIDKFKLLYEEYNKEMSA